MPSYKYLLPLVSICPPPGYRLIQSLVLKHVGAMLDRPDAQVVLSRILLQGDRELAREDNLLTFAEGDCTSEAARHEVSAPEEDGWMTGGPMPFLETHISIEGDGQFQSQFPPDFYTIYAGPERKSFFSDNALKYGNTVTILQIEAFGAWVEGYPASMVDPARDIDESVILINPFLRPAVVDVTLEGIDRKRRFRINAQTGQRISLAGAFEIGEEGWNGQVYVSGRNRVVMYVAKHSLRDPSKVTTVEHSNPYRGEPTHVPITKLLRRKIGTALSLGR